MFGIPQSVWVAPDLTRIVIYLRKQLIMTLLWYYQIYFNIIVTHTQSTSSTMNIMSFQPLIMPTFSSKPFDQMSGEKSFYIFQNWNKDN